MKTTIVTTLAALSLAACGSPFSVDQQPGTGHDAGHDDTGDAVARDAGHTEASPGDAEADAHDAVAPQPEAGGDATAPVCTSDLSNVGTGDFAVIFTLTTDASFPTGTSMAIARQRTGCDQSSTFWDITMNSEGGISASTDDGIPGHYVFVESDHASNDGQPHTIGVARIGGHLFITRDEVEDSLAQPDTDNLGAMPPLTRGTDVCANVVPTVGTVTNFCLYVY